MFPVLRIEENLHLLQVNQVGEGRTLLGIPSKGDNPTQVLKRESLFTLGQVGENLPLSQQDLTEESQAGLMIIKIMIEDLHEWLEIHLEVSLMTGSNLVCQMEGSQKGDHRAT